MTVKRLFLSLFIAIFTLSFSGSYVLAQESKELDTNQRLNLLVAKHKIVLSEQEATEIIQSCNQKQQSIFAIQSQIDTSVSKRMQLYTELINQISAIEHRLIRQGADASELDLLIGRIQLLIDDLTVSADNYGLVAEDSRLINCQSSPEKFAASIKELQDTHYKIVAISDELAEVVKASTNTTFKSLSERLSI